MISPVHPGQRGCTPVTPGCTLVKYWTPAGAVRKGILRQKKNRLFVKNRLGELPLNLAGESAPISIISLFLSVEMFL